VPEHSIDNNNLHGNSSLQVPQHSIDNNNLHGKLVTVAYKYRNTL
jgi:hypothetical protein